MLTPEFGPPDQRLVEIKHQVRNYRAGDTLFSRMIPNPLIRMLPDQFGKKVNLWLAPPSIEQLASEIASFMDLEEWERDLFARGFWWRINNQLHLDIQRRNSSISPFFTSPAVRDNPKLLQELKDKEEGVKNVTRSVIELTNKVFPDLDSSIVVEWLDQARRSGANLGTAFYNPDSELETLKSQLIYQSGRMKVVREKVPPHVRNYLNNGYRDWVRPLYNSGS